MGGWKFFLISSMVLMLMVGAQEFHKATISYSYKSEDINMLPATDTFLMVPVGKNLLVGTAQLFCRHLQPPYEQVFLLTNFTVDNGVMESGLKDGIEVPQFKYSPDYGCLTQVNNFGYIDLNNLNPGSKRPTPLTKHYKITPREKLSVGQAVKAFYYELPSGKIGSKDIKVVDFKNCKEVFDPEDLMLVDEDEQFCTQQISPIPKRFTRDFVKAVPTGVLLIGDELVGIESKAMKGFSLSTFVPYHHKEVANLL